MAEGIVNIGASVSKHPKGPLQGPIRIFQLTDCHLHADPHWRLAGVNTQASFESVISLAKKQPAGADLILLTGDLVHDASVTGYNRMADHIECFGLPTYCLPGNHDKPPILTEHMNSPLVSTPKVVDLGNWLLILLDSVLPGSEGGHLDRAELDFLQEALEAFPEHHVLICLHHHPIPINSAWMDNISLDNPAPFFNITDNYSNIRGMLWGHIHQAFEAQRQGVRMMGSPSTCIQFIQNQDAFGISPSPPGFRWLELMPDGTINTAVEQVEQLPEGLLLDTAGY
jgi:Icc protein